MHGVQKAYYCAPPALKVIALHGGMNFAVAAADARLEVVVALSGWLAQPQHPSVSLRQIYLTDRVFDWISFNEGHIHAPTAATPTRT